MMVAEKIVDPRQALANPWIYRKFQRLLRRDTTTKRLLAFLDVKAGQRVLDLGCGPAEILAHLPQDIDYNGYDLDERYIAFAKQRYGTRGSFVVRAIVPDMVNDLSAFDTVICIGVLHHLTDHQVNAVFASAAKILRPGGRIVTCDGAFVKGQNLVARLLLMLDRGRYVRKVEAYLSLAQNHFPQATATILHDLLAVPYTHCIITASKPSTS